MKNLMNLLPSAEILCPFIVRIREGPYYSSKFFLEEMYENFGGT